MGVVTRQINGEYHYNVLTDFVKRGDLYAAFTNDGKTIWVNWGDNVGYPTGETFTSVPVEHIPDLIAVLTAVMQHRK